MEFPSRALGMGALLFFVWDVLQAPRYAQGDNNGEHFCMDLLKGDGGCSRCPDY